MKNTMSALCLGIGLIAGSVGAQAANAPKKAIKKPVAKAAESKTFVTVPDMDRDQSVRVKASDIKLAFQKVMQAEGRDGLKRIVNRDGSVTFVEPVAYQGAETYSFLANTLNLNYLQRTVYQGSQNLEDELCQYLDFSQAISALTKISVVPYENAKIAIVYVPASKILDFVVVNDGSLTFRNGGGRSWLMLTPEENRSAKIIKEITCK